MKSFFFVMMMLVFSTAYAEETVPPPAQVHVTGHTSSIGLLTASEVTRAIRHTAGAVSASVNRKLDAWKKQDEKKFSNISSQVAGMSSDLKKVAQDTAATKGAVTNLDSKLTGKNGEFAKTNAAIKDIDGSFLMMTLMIILVVIVVAVALYLLLRKSIEKVGKKVDEVPEKTAEKVREAEKLTLHLSVGGRNFTFIPQIKDNMYESLYVPGEGIVPVHSPAETQRMLISRKDKLISSSRSVLAKYVDWDRNGKPALGDEREKQQMALVEHLLAKPTYELTES